VNFVHVGLNSEKEWGNINSDAVKLIVKYINLVNKQDRERKE
jgi:hypothetical protein